MSDVEPGKGEFMHSSFTICAMRPGRVGFWFQRTFWEVVVGW